MKISNLAVIFVVIALTVITVLTNYISLQRQTLIKQQEYDAKLIDSTKEAIDAFEINTVQWNADFSAGGDSKRRSIMGSINTFTTTLANNMHISGSSRESLLSYIPAIAYTLYDGYYIYSPTEVRETVRDDDGLAVTYSKNLVDDGIISGSYDSANDGKILYVSDGTGINGTYTLPGEDSINFTFDETKARIKYTHILKPFSAYAEKAKATYDGHDEIAIINYTLDNYVSVYGKLPETDSTEEYVFKQGYLTDPNKIQLTSQQLYSVYYKFDENGPSPERRLISPEHLEERIAYRDNPSDDLQTGTFNYVYEAEAKQRVYYDGSNFFTLDKENVRVYINTKTEPTYKKCVVPYKPSGLWSYINLYQDLETGTWYREYTGDDTKYNVSDSVLNGYFGSINRNDRLLDFSGINYCVESKVFTDWFNSLDLEVEEKDEDGNVTDHLELEISSDNDPELKESKFGLHKREVIKNVLEDNLNQAITGYGRNTARNYRMPELAETDWDQLLTNTSIIAFLQEIPIGLKMYNSYAIATSTENREMVDVNELYFNRPGDEYYHMPYCEKLGNSGLIGYRSIEYLEKSYREHEDSNKLKYYYSHSKNNNTHIDVDQKCYYCMVEKSNYVGNTNKKDSSLPASEQNLDRSMEKETAFYTTIARERYVTKPGRLPIEALPEYRIIGRAVDSSGDPRTGKIHIDVEGEALDPGSSPSRTKEILKDTPKKYTVHGDTEDTYDTAVPIGDLSGKSEYDMVTGNIYPVQNDPTGGGTLSDHYSNGSVEIDVIQYTATGGVVAHYNKSLDDVYKIEVSDPNFGYIDYSTGYIYLEESCEIIVELVYHDIASDSMDNISAWANIDDQKEITIVTDLINPNDLDQKIDGFVILHFTNNKGNEKYSQDIFKVEKGSRIACKIDDDADFYDEEWNVTVEKPGGSRIVGPVPISYYTLKNQEELHNFSNLTNCGGENSKQLRTANRKFHLINNIDAVGPIEPINLIEKGAPGGNKYIQTKGIPDQNITWFDGYFSGKDHGSPNGTIPETIHRIQGARIAYDGGLAEAYGLFGRLGGPATVENLIIEDIKIEFSNSENIQGVGLENDKTTVRGHGEHIGVGGLAGYADTSSSANADPEGKKDRIENVKIVNPTIVGTSYSSKDGEFIGDIVGGLVGQSKKKVTRCELSGGTVKSYGKIIGIDKDYRRLKKGWINGVADKIDTFFNGAHSGQEVGMGSIYVGGLVGLQLDNTISGTVTGGAVVGNGDVEVTTIPKQDIDEAFQWWIEDYSPRNQYYVGGIVSYIKNANIEPNANTTITGDSVVKGGGMLWTYNGNKRQDSKSANFTGGIIGFSDGADFLNDDDNPAVIGNATITGYENVGGVIGLNNGGNLSNIVFVGKVKTNTVQVGNRWSATTEYGQNEGGIVGCNEGNGKWIDDGGTGVIQKCYSKGAEIKDGKNTGGIVGASYGGWIDLCGNEGTVLTTHNKNTWVNQSGNIENANDMFSGLFKIIGDAIENKATLFNGYAFGNTECYGIGGIAGKTYGDSYITRCYNSKSASVKGNMNVGGIVGVQNWGKIRYCFNAGNIVSETTGTARFGSAKTVIGHAFEIPTDSEGGRVGGIAGTAAGTEIDYCYNIGRVTGDKNYSVLFNGIGGIVGQQSDNDGQFAIGNYTLFKDESQYNFLNAPGVDVYYLHMTSYQNKINYCYNSGIITCNGDFFWSELADDLSSIPWIGPFLADALKAVTIEKLQLYHVCGIAGNVTYHINLDISSFMQGNSRWMEINNCYYTKDSARYGATSSWSGIIAGDLEYSSGKASSYERVDSNYLKTVILQNKWAKNNKVPNSEPWDRGYYIYNTTAPLITNIGFDGYGVLWWQLKDNYYKRIIYVYDKDFTDSASGVKGPAIYDPVLYVDGTPIYYSGEEYVFNGEKYHAFTIALEKGNQHTISATAGNDLIKYTGGETKTVDESSPEVIDLYLGARPEIVIAEQCTDSNGSIDKSNVTIPAGNYYVIMAGGGGSGNWVEAHNKPGGGSGAGYIAYIKLNEKKQYSIRVGGGGYGNVSGR